MTRKDKVWPLYRLPWWLPIQTLFMMRSCATELEKKTDFYIISWRTYLIFQTFMDIKRKINWWYVYLRQIVSMTNVEKFFHQFLLSRWMFYHITKMGWCRSPSKIIKLWCDNYLGRVKISTAQLKCVLF